MSSITWLVGSGVAMECLATQTHGQPTPPATALLPEPIYWKQNLFLIPYQWSSAADPGTAQIVWLLVSKDRGATWQKISEAKPHVKAFNYHAAGDGEHMFAIRTIDVRGQAWPTGPYQPELCVVVDTTMPRIDELAGELRDDGTLAIRWRGADLNLAPDTWRIEAQSGPTGSWQPVPLIDPIAGETLWQPPPGAPPTAIRATVHDLAGNSAMSQAVVRSATSGAATANQWHTINGASVAMGSNTVPRPVQQWPASATTNAPFRLTESSGTSPHDAVTTYGQPQIVASAPDSKASAPLPADGLSGWTSPVTNNSTTPLPAQPVADRYAMVSTSKQSSVRPLEPFREASLAKTPPDSDVVPIHDRLEANDSSRSNASAGTPQQPPLIQKAAAQHGESSLAIVSPTINQPPPASPGFQAPPGVVPKQIGSRTFALEYQLTDMGQRGVSSVELWGTHDGGQTWQRFAADDDHRSPLYVTVDDAGLYGFRIVVEAAGGPAASVPRAGDVPELWVTVDLDRPRAELLSIQTGVGSSADQLILRWLAEDTNLDPRPISLFYSSRPSGPWSAITTNLTNTGEYTWHVERHVPARIYLRLEARDAAGNLAAYQTAEPMALPTPEPGAELQSVTSVGPTATGAESTYR